MFCFFVYWGSFVIYCCIFVLWLFVYYYHVDSAGSTSSFSSENTNQGLSSPPPQWSSPTIPPPIVSVCFSNEFQCRDGGCVKSEYRCDNINDCKDQSDELNCGKYDLLTSHKVCRNITLVGDDNCFSLCRDACISIF